MDTRYNVSLKERISKVLWNYALEIVKSDVNIQISNY
jgi:hypothetical protein